jgi:nucleotide-binding universal stress UspA family protein
MPAPTVPSPLWSAGTGHHPWRMSEDMMRPVVLGVDGSSSATAAVNLAAGEAEELGVGLRIVHAYVWPLLYASLANVPYRAEEWEPGAESRAMVEAVARRTRAAYPDLAVQAQVRAGGGGAVLVEESARASLVVLGGRGVGGVAGLLAGPVAMYVASHAHCPVIVAREGQRRPATDAPVVVGMDGSASAQAALMFAAGWAARRGVDVHAVHAEPAGDPGEVERWVDQGRRDFPTVRIQTTVASSPAAADALVRASRSARMVVVGSRRRGEVASVLLGSVGHALIRGALCPVAVVHESRVTTPTG